MALEVEQSVNAFVSGEPNGWFLQMLFPLQATQKGSLQDIPGMARVLPSSTKRGGFVAPARVRLERDTGHRSFVFES